MAPKASAWWATVGGSLTSTYMSSVRSSPTPSAPRATAASVSTRVATLAASSTRTPSAVAAGSVPAISARRLRASPTAAAWDSSAAMVSASGSMWISPAPPSTATVSRTGQRLEQAGGPHHRGHAEGAGHDGGVAGA